jgi:murein DD-endopeptidase MepM/ murein hydrolase activator NlpD
LAEGANEFEQTRRFLSLKYCKPVRRLLALTLAPLFAVAAAANDRIEIVWPTPNRAWEEGRPISAYIQPTASGDPQSGCYGDVRSNGIRFHEGIDIKSAERDRRGEPMDRIRAAMPGVVRYVNSRSDGDYGRYIVIEHPGITPSVYTLYAHLASVLPGIAPGTHVELGQEIAIMGHSSSTGIPRERAHLHFEIGVMVTREFQNWYDSKRFGSPNERGLWNGFNLMGFDPLDFYNKWRARQVDNVQEYFGQMKAQVTARIVTHRVPDFIQRYPSLLQAPLPAGLVGGWEIQFDWTGIPFAWRPLALQEVMGLATDQVTILRVDRSSVAQHRGKILVRPQGGGYGIGRDLETVLQQLFGLR